MDEQREIVDKGGTMRLGAYPAKLLAGSIVREAYGEEVVYERHRHRYEVNNNYRRRLEESGLVCSGTSPTTGWSSSSSCRTSMHPFFVATQAHPEFKSRPDRPHPLFAAFVARGPGAGRGSHAAPPAHRRAGRRRDLTPTSVIARCLSSASSARSVVADAGFLTITERADPGARRRGVHAASSCTIPARSWSCRSTMTT